MNTYYGRPAGNSLAILLAACLATPVALAQETPQQDATLQEEEQELTVSGSVELGGEYNSNVSITELESATGQSDTAATLGGELDLGWRPTDRLTANAGYSYDGTYYQDFDDFDLGMHLVYGDIAYEFDSLSLGINHYHADASLGGDGFLTLKQSSVYAGKLFAEQIFLRAALSISDKRFDTIRERDADGDGLGLDAFWFFSEGQNLMLGYSYDEERARLRQFSYDGHTARLRYSNRFRVTGMDARLQVGMRVEERDYRGVTPLIDARRDDSQRIAEGQFNLSLSDHLALVTRLERGHYRSNLSSADYTENRASVSVKYSF